MIYNQWLMTKKEKWVYWIKHHIVTVVLFGIACLALLYILGTKTAYVVVDNNQTRTYKPGVTLLYTKGFPNDYYGRPDEWQIFCIDGEKVAVMNGVAIIKLEQYCE